MSGTQTHNFDFVMELSESFYNDVFREIFDSDGFLCNHILEPIGAGGLCDLFTVDVRFDRPADVTLPPAAANFLDIRIDLGNSGSAGHLRFIVGVDVDRSSADHDTIRMNFHDLLFFAEASLVGLPIPSGLLASVLRDQVKALALPPSFPVTRTATEATVLQRADARIIDDTSGADLDASGLLLTFGGGTAGNINAFTQSFLPAGETGGLAFFFDWLCRILSPVIEEKLNLGAGNFAGCVLHNPVTVSEDDDVDLTRLELVLNGDFLQLTAAVKKSGFCYEATGTVVACLKLKIEGGHLLVDAEVDHPDVDIDIPWYCWLAAIAVGAILAVLGGVLFGAIGAIVGAVIIPLIMWIGTQVIEGVIERVAATITDKINDIVPAVDVPLVGLNLILQEAFIDDIVIQMRPQVVSNAPVRSEGVVILSSGMYVDLDSGKVGGEDLPSADLGWNGSQFFGLMGTLCNSALARTGSRDYDGMTRSRLYAFHYESPAQVPMSELATIDPFGGIFGGDIFKETLTVFGAHTNEDRFAALRVVRVEGDAIHLQYRTFEKNLPTVAILGDFQCESIFLPPKGAETVFVPVGAPAPVLGANAGANTGQISTGVVTAPCPPQPASGLDATLARSLSAALPRATLEQAALQAKPLSDRRVGNFVSRFHWPMGDLGTFVAATNGLHGDITYRWEIDGQALEGESGQVTVKGVIMGYSITGRRLTLHITQGKAIEFELKVTVTDAQKVTLATSRCIRYTPECAQVIRTVPDWTISQVTHLQYFGVVEVAPPAPTPVPPIG